MVKAWCTDVGIEVANLGIRSTAAWVISRKRAPPSICAMPGRINRGTNGIQAADLVAHKLGLDGGVAFDGLIADIEAETTDARLIALTDAVEVAATMRSSAADAGWPAAILLDVRSDDCGLAGRAHGPKPGCNDRVRTPAIFLANVVPEALGLGAAARRSSTALFDCGGSPR